jgi:cadmium resistance protein CadD (predicted permease)
LERPSWAPVILSGALPRELSDLLAISILALASLESVFAQLQSFNQPAWFATLLGLVPMTCALAALSNSSRTQKEELALFAYGGAGWQIQLRYVVRGFVVAVIGLLPLWLKFIATENVSSLSLVLFLLSAAVGGLSYAAPALKRTRSLAFVEQYKG